MQRDVVVIIIIVDLLPSHCCFPCRQEVIKYVDKLDAGKMRWKSFRKYIRKAHKQHTGGPHFREPGQNPKLEENFFANPYPGCICEAIQIPGKPMQVCQRTVEGTRRCFQHTIRPGE